jgi:hypothetical protein
MFVWYVVMVYVMYQRWINWYLGMFMVATGMVVICALGSTAQPFWDAMLTTVIDGPGVSMAYMPLYVMGCIFAASIRELGVAESLIKRTIELGGDRPYVVCVLLFLVWTYISCAVNGPAGVILVGTITLPVMMAMGVEPFYATAFHMLGWTTAQPLWVVYWPSSQIVFNVWPGDHMPWLYMNLIVMAVLSIAYITFAFKTQMGLPIRWMTPAAPPEEAEEMAPSWTYILPGIPVILILGNEWFRSNPLGAFIICTSINLFICIRYLRRSGKMRTMRDFGSLTERIFYGGAVDAVGLLMVFFATGWVTVAGRQTLLKSIVGVGMQGLVASGIISMLIWTIVLCPLTWYRGRSIFANLFLAIFAGIPTLGANTRVLWWTVSRNTGTFWWMTGPTLAYLVWAAEVCGVSSNDYIPSKFNMAFSFAMALIPQIITFALFPTPNIF